MIVSLRCTLIAIAFLLCSMAELFGQRRYYDVWQFSYEKGFDFRNGSAAETPGSTGGLEGSSSICDPYTGELLFYSNGEGVWNRNHELMKNGTGLFGHWSSTQSALIVPHPGDSLLFYLFTTDERTASTPRGLGMHYSIVDMRGDNGLGEVVEKNVGLLSAGTEKLVGIRHSDNCTPAYWIVTHELGTDRFYAWLLTKNGLSKDPLISRVGSIYDHAWNGRAYDAGPLEASPNGELLVASRIVSDLSGGTAELFRFDPSTGVVGPKMDEFPSGYGLSFSPDNNLLYTSHKDSLVQYDLRSGPGRIAESRKILSQGNSIDPNAQVFWGMQLGPDGKIYVIHFTPALNDKMVIGAINNPNVVGAGAAYTPVLFTFGDRYGLGLPNCIDGYLGEADTTIVPEILKLRIRRDYRQRTNMPLVISVELVESAGSTNISELEFALEYDRHAMLADAESIKRLLKGTVLEGWNVEIRENGAGRMVVRLTAPPGITLSGSGTLLRFESELYLADVRGTELSFTVSAMSRCYAFETEAGYAELDICGLNFRLIELTSEKYVAPLAYPNPARERVTFEFGLGLDGPTRLEVFDALGNRVGVIVDEMLEPGGYAVEWDVRDVASGIYWYRLMSGDWSEGGEVLIQK